VDKSHFSLVPTRKEGAACNCQAKMIANEAGRKRPVEPEIRIAGSPDWTATESQEPENCPIGRAQEIEYHERIQDGTFG
jgi:hypothetical protein